MTLFTSFKAFIFPLNEEICNNLQIANEKNIIQTSPYDGGIPLPPIHKKHYVNMQHNYVNKQLDYLNMQLNNVVCQYNYVAY